MASSKGSIVNVDFQTIELESNGTEVGTIREVETGSGMEIGTEVETTREVKTEAEVGATIEGVFNTEVETAPEVDFNTEVETLHESFANLTTEEPEDYAPSAPPLDEASASCMASPAKRFKKDYPDAEQLAEMKFVYYYKGPTCYSCFLSGTLEFHCPQCNRYYHKNCILNDMPGKQGFPVAIFNKPLEEVTTAENLDDVQLLECPNCRVEKKTQFKPLEDTPHYMLTLGLSKMAMYLDCSELLENYPTDGPFTAVSFEIIKEKAKKGEYTSLEGLYGDVRRIVYNVIYKYHTDEFKEATEICRIIMNILGGEIMSMTACLDCYLKRWDSDGVRLNAADYFDISLEVCKKPHPLVLLKGPGFPAYWPSKLLAQQAENILVLQCFGEGASIREIPFPLPEGYDIRTLSHSFMRRRHREVADANYENALNAVRRHLNRLEIVFRDTPMFLTEYGAQYDGNFDALFSAQFPQYSRFEAFTNAIRQAVALTVELNILQKREEAKKTPQTKD